MPHVNLTSQYPGITGLLEDHPEPGAPIRDLTQYILRGPNSLTVGERELIASVVCVGNECQFCSTAHVTTAARYMDSVEQVHAILSNPFAGDVSPRIAHLLQIAGVVRTGGAVPDEMVADARIAGATDTEIHDTVLIAALFSLYNRYVDGLKTDLPSDASYYDMLADRLTTTGYVRPGNRNGSH